MAPRRAAPALAALVFLSLAAAGCAAPASAPGDDARSEPSGALTGEITVFAAASLQAAFDEIAADFEADHPGADVAPISYDGSSTLATQILEGAPADLFASANEASMQQVVDAGLAPVPALFATNTLVIAVPPGNPGGIADLADLAHPALTVVLCAQAVPCGSASVTLLDNAGVTLAPASLEQSVTAVLTKVAAGEADAGLVYATDVIGRTDVSSIVPAGADAVVNRYLIAALAGSAPSELAAAFVDHVLSPAGRGVLAAHGFGAP